MSRSLLARLGVPAVLTVAAAAPRSQNVVVCDLPAAMFAEAAGVSPIYPGGGPMLFGYPCAPPLPILAPLAGGASLDGTNGMTWYTNGVMIAAVPHGAYPAGVPPVPPYPVPPGLGGPVTGLALDPIAGMLWLTDGALVMGVVPGPGGPVVMPPFPPALPLAGPLTGLEWDPWTGSLWACDAAGFAYNFLPGGGPLGPPVAPPGPLPAAAAGITIDKTGLAMPAAPRSLYVVAGPIVADLSTGAMFPSNAGAAAVGIAFHPAPSPIPAGPPCPCPSFAHGQVLTGPCSAGSATFGIDLVGLPPGNPVVFLFDLAFNPAFPLINGSGCPLGVNLGAPTLFSLPGAAGPNGVARLPLPLVGVPAGLLIHLQYATLCPGDPAGFVLTPLYRVAVALP